MNNRPTTSRITVRQTTFSSNNLQKQYTHSALMSHFLTALSMSFPQGERFFVETVRNVRDQISDQDLQADISAFIGQESHHAQAHQQFNTQIQTEHYHLKKFDAAFEKEMHRLRTLSPRRQLAATVALEHFTAIIAGYMLKYPHLLKELSPNMSNLWIWHAVEEIEHKHVAFDVYQQVFNNLPQRRRSMRTITLGFLSSNIIMTSTLLWQDRQHSLFKPRQLCRNIKDLGLFAHMAISLLPEYLAFYKANFHPSEIDQTALLVKGKEFLALNQLTR
jgi:predicted metal-dependent hydrolase